MIYLRARYYDASTGQFISRDPAVAATRQPYAYVNDSPLNGTDPTGLYDCGWQVWNCINNPFTTSTTQLHNNFVNNFQNGGYIAVALPLVGLAALPCVFGGCAAAAGALGLGGGATAVNEAEQLGPATVNEAIPICEQNAGHIFRSAVGHLASDSAANRQILLNTANNGANYVGTNSTGVATYRATLQSGSQAWAEVYNGQITNGGVNQVPR